MSLAYWYMSPSCTCWYKNCILVHIFSFISCAFHPTVKMNKAKQPNAKDILLWKTGDSFIHGPLPHDNEILLKCCLLLENICIVLWKTVCHTSSSNIIITRLGKARNDLHCVLEVRPLTTQLETCKQWQKWSGSLIWSDEVCTWQLCKESLNCIYCIRAKIFKTRSTRWLQNSIDGLWLWFMKCVCCCQGSKM